MENDHTTWSDERLSERLSRLNAIDQPWQGSRERREQIRREREIIIFEQTERYREARGIRVAEAYGEVQEAYDNMEAL